MIKEEKEAGVSFEIETHSVEGEYWLIVKTDESVVFWVNREELTLLHEQIGKVLYG